MSGASNLPVNQRIPIATALAAAAAANNINGHVNFLIVCLYKFFVINLIKFSLTNLMLMKYNNFKLI